MDIKKLISQMTLEEKASLCSGADFWHTKAVERLGIPSVMLSDGPHGLRKQATAGDHLGINDSVQAVCFPAASATAASFDVQAIREVGQAIGDACQHEGVAVALGPAVNIKRSPLCGRNFEYFSEDPYLTAEMAVAYIQGVQSRNVGTSVKHFAANNQEARRMSSDSVVDERTLREIYFPAFEAAVKRGKGWTVMCSYNRINGAYAAESHELLTQILRDAWGFDGYVVSDWGATGDRVKGLIAGMDLEMPASGGVNDQLIVEAVREGALEEQVLDTAVERILRIHARFLDQAKPGAPWDKEAQHAAARRIAAECMVLLKNEDKILPLREGERIAVIGKFAKAPRYQGGGSSHVNSFKVTSLMDALDGVPGVVYAQGYDTRQDQIDEALMAEAVRAAKAAGVAVIVAGLPDAFESEGYDRSHMRMPDCQVELIRRVAAANPNTVVVLYNGSPVEMPWAPQVKGIVEAYLGGQAVGGATRDVLFGAVNPCGRLPETFAQKLEDNPSYLTFGGEGDHVVYNEGVFVGYRYYEKKRMDVLFPFGYGLSYTTFEYSNLRLDAQTIRDTESLRVCVDVTNTGPVAGKEVVQLYVADRQSTVFRPVRELKGFEKVLLAPGETQTVTFTLSKDAFAYWNTQIHDWHVETGDFGIQIGRNSRDIVLEKDVFVQSTVQLPVTFTRKSIFADVMANERGRETLGKLMDVIKQSLGQEQGDAQGETAEAAISGDMMAAMLQYMPLRSVVTFSQGKMSYAQLDQMIQEINRQ